jgi:hypothetical protein
MTRWMVVALVAALAGCAGVQRQWSSPSTVGQRDASGHWVGELDRDGWLQPLAVDIEQENGAYRGELRSAAGVRSRPLESVNVQGEEVRFETDKLRFVGHVSGSILSGTVTQKPADARFGDFSVSQEEPERTVYSPASEWAPDVIP